MYKKLDIENNLIRIEVCNQLYAHLKQGKKWLKFENFYEFHNFHRKFDEEFNFFFFNLNISHCFQSVSHLVGNTTRTCWRIFLNSILCVVLIFCSKFYSISLRLNRIWTRNVRYYGLVFLRGSHFPLTLFIYYTWGLQFWEKAYILFYFPHNRTDAQFLTIFNI